MPFMFKDPKFKEAHGTQLKDVFYYLLSLDLESNFIIYPEKQLCLNLTHL